MEGRMSVQDFDNSPYVQAHIGIINDVAEFVRFILDTDDTFTTNGARLIPTLDGYTFTIDMKRVGGSSAE